MTEETRTPLLTNPTNGPETRESPTEFRHVPIFGQYKPWEHFSGHEKCLSLVSITGRAASLCTTLYKLLTLPRNVDDYTFTIIMGITSLFCAFHAVYGVLKESWPHIVANFVTGAVLVIYGAIHYEFLTSAFLEEEVGILVRLAISAAVIALSARSGYLLVKEYRRKGWRICTIGNSEGTAYQQARLTRFFICGCLITFDLQIQITVLFFVLETGLDMTLAEGIILSTGLLATVAWAIAGFEAIRTQNKWWLSAFLLLWLHNIAYIEYKRYRLPYLAPAERWTPLYQATLWCLGINVLSKAALATALLCVFFDFGPDFYNTQLQMNDAVGESQSPSSSAGESSSSNCVTQLTNR